MKTGLTLASKIASSTSCARIKRKQEVATYHASALDGMHRVQEALAAFLPLLFKALLFKVPRVQDTTCVCTALFWDLATRGLFHGNQ